MTRCSLGPGDNARTFFTSNRFFASLLSTALPADGAGTSTSISLSAMLLLEAFVVCLGKEMTKMDENVKAAARKVRARLVVYMGRDTSVTR